MKETIIVAGEKQVTVGKVHNHITRQGYRSVPCRTVESIIDELKVLPGWGEHVSLVVIEPGMLNNISDKLAAELVKCFAQSPFCLTVVNDIKEHGIQLEC